MLPETFEAALKRYDPALSLRWGPVVKAWVVDRTGKITRPLWDVLEQATQLPSCEPIDHERFISAKSGKRPVLHTPILGNHVFNELWANDLQVHGTKVVDRHMKRMEEERLKKRNDDTNSRAVAEGLDFLSRRRATPSKEEQERIFAEVTGKSFSGSKSRRKVNRAIVDPAGVPIGGTPDKKIEIATR